jgi:hypothetical protein
MLRKVLIALAGIVLSFVLIGLAGYALYLVSDRYTESQLGWFARYVFSPATTACVGFVVGFFSKDHAEHVAFIALLPWALFLSSQSSTSVPALHWQDSLVTLIALAMGVDAGRVAWRLRLSTMLKAVNATPNTHLTTDI